MLTSKKTTFSYSEIAIRMTFSLTIKYESSLWASGCWHYERTLYSRRPLKGTGVSIYLSPHFGLIGRKLTAGIIDLCGSLGVHFRLLGGSFRRKVVTTVGNIVFSDLGRQEVCYVLGRRTSVFSLSSR